MEKSRFDELMRQHPNWVNRENIHEVFTFFDGLYTHKGGVKTEDEQDHYRLEENENGLKIELAASGKRYVINEDRRGQLPEIQLFPRDESGDEVLFLVPKV